MTRLTQTTWVTLALALTACQASVPSTAMVPAPSAVDVPGAAIAPGSAGAVVSQPAAAPVETAAGLTGRVMLGEQPFTGADVRLYLPGAAEALGGQATTDAQGAYSLPLDGIDAPLVKLVAHQGDRTLVALVSTKAAKAGYRVFATAADVNAATTFAYVALARRLAGLKLARLSSEQVDQVMTTFTTFSQTVGAGLKAKSAAEHELAIARALAKSGTGELPQTVIQATVNANAKIGQQFVAASGTLGTILQAAVSASNPDLATILRTPLTLGNHSAPAVIRGRSSNGNTTTITPEGPTAPVAPTPLTLSETFDTLTKRDAATTALWDAATPGYVELTRDNYGITPGTGTAPYHPTASTTLAPGEYEFSSITIPSGVVITVEGDVTLRATGDIDIAGQLSGAGSSGASGQNGQNGPAIRLESGQSITIGGTIESRGGAGGDADLQLETRGNGGFGGMINIWAIGSMTISGQVRSIGGNAGDDPEAYGMPGSPMSGDIIWLKTPQLTNSGLVSSTYPDGGAGSAVEVMSANEVTLDSHFVGTGNLWTRPNYTSGRVMITQGYDMGDDTHSTVTHTGFTPDATVTQGTTSITYAFSCSPSGLEGTYTDWTDDITTLNGRFLRVKATLATTSSSQTPRLNGFSVQYHH